MGSHLATKGLTKNKEKLNGQEQFNHNEKKDRQKKKE